MNPSFKYCLEEYMITKKSQAQNTILMRAEEVLWNLILVLMVFHQFGQLLEWIMLENWFKWIKAQWVQFATFYIEDNVYNSTFLDSYSVFARVWGNYSTSVMIVFRAQTLSALSSCPPLQANHSQQCRLGPCAKYFTFVIITNQHYTIHQLCQKFWQNTTPFYVLFLHLCTFPRTASAAAQSSCFLMHLTVSRAFIAFIMFDFLIFFHLWNGHQGGPSASLCTVEHHLVEGALH